MKKLLTMKKILQILLLLSICFAGTAFAAEQAFFYHTDPAGTPLAMTDASGNVVWKADYKPFGEENSTTGSAANDRRFVGKEKDDETGLSYFGARYEDAKIGRFIAPDPVRAVDPHSSKTNEKILADPQRLNTYSYALNNPYAYIDPFGLSGILIVQSSGNGGSSMLSGHSWITYNKDGGGTTTYGTWGNNPMYMGNGLHENLEAGRTADASRATHINDAQEAKLMGAIKEYKEKGADAWQYGAPCSTFARDSWEAGTGEYLNSNYGPISNPTTLKESIISANGGVNHLNAPNVSNGSSTTLSPSSSSHSSGFSLNSSGSLF
jgi:RHS repeat-associated protein